MNTKYMIVISFDAVSSSDIEYLKTLPNFSKLIERGALIKNVKSIYPTLTYPAHATIVTGRTPDGHGIIDNTIFRVGDFNPNWYWYRKDVKVETLYDLAKKKGLSTCSMLWPVTGKANIDYNLPEIFSVKPHQHQLLMSANAGTLGFQLELNKRFGKLRKGISQPYLDNFVMESSKYTIKKYAPNLMLIHLTDVDTLRHNYGYDSKEANEALLRHDKRLGEIVEALKEKGIYDETTIVALGDHSAMNASKIIKLNTLLKREGLIKLKSNGKILDYKAICKSLDGSAYIYLKDSKDEETKIEIRKILNELLDKEESPIEFILEGEEVSKAGGDRKASFMVEGSMGYYFVDDVIDEFIETIKEEEVGVKKHRYKAIHGYSPEKPNYGTFFIGAGNGFKNGVVLESGELLNHGPTLAKILGLKFNETDGVEVEEVLDM